jgi:hypothetical protein
MTGVFGSVWVTSISAASGGHGGVVFSSSATLLPSGASPRAVSLTVPK